MFKLPMFLLKLLAQYIKNVFFKNKKNECYSLSQSLGIFQNLYSAMKKNSIKQTLTFESNIRN